MSNEIEITHVDTTVDSGNEVYKIEGSDGQLHCIPAPKEGSVYVPTIMCPGETRFSELVTKAVERFEMTTIKIPNIMNSDLIEKLDGFEKTTEIHQGIGEPVDVWVGEWRVD